MKKVVYLSIVLVLLAVSVVPVMAKGPNNGQGNSANKDEGNSSEVTTGNNGHGNHHNDGKHQVPGGNASTSTQGNESTSSHGNGNGNRPETRTSGPFYLQGIISAFDTDAMTVTVTLVHGSAPVKQFIGTTLDLTVNEATHIFMITQGDGGETGSEQPSLTASPSGENGNEEPDGDRVPIELGGLIIGERVAIHGRIMDNTYLATMITMYITAPVGEPSGG